MDALLDWARERPRSQQTRLAVLDRYVGIVLPGSEVFRFLEQNQAAAQGMETGKERFARLRDRLDGLVDVLAGPGPRCVTRCALPPPCWLSARPACSICSVWTTRTNCAPSCSRRPPT